jgi:hypothetical protein
VTTRGKLIWVVVMAVAASAPSAFGVGVYLGGGLAAYGETKVRTPEIITDGDMGTTWAVGGGLAIPVWWRPGTVTPSVDLTTDVSFSMIDSEFENPFLRNNALKVTAIPIREAVIFGIGVGPSAMIKPYIGFGGGVTIVKWEAYYIRLGSWPNYLYNAKIDGGTAVKPTFSIPFGCDFRLGSNFSLGPRAEYLVITGKVDGYDPWPEPDEPFSATVPDIFLFGAQARFDF